MFARTAAGAVALLILGAVTLVGVACAAIAIDLALTPPIGPAWAAAVTAVILLVAPVTLWIVLTIKGARGAPKEGEAAVLQALASLAKDNPMMALVGAAIYGAADVLIRRSRR